MTFRGEFGVLGLPCCASLWRCSKALVSPPGATLGFVLALSLPLVLVPLFSVDAALLVLAPLLIACSRKGDRPCP